jgi:predicted transcriptional regulator YheO
MEGNLLKQFINLTEFLGLVLGPDYEVALHDVADAENSIIAIANGRVSGRGLGAPLSDYTRNILLEKVFEEKDYLINYKALAVENDTMLRSSTFFIKGERGTVELLLCINFTDERYRDLSDRLLKLRHPDEFVDTNFVYNKEKASREWAKTTDGESFHGSITTAIQTAIEQVLRGTGVPVERLTMDEKLEIISLLHRNGVFRLKGAVKQVASELKSSPASIYRYLERLEDEKNG